MKREYLRYSDTDMRLLLFGGAYGNLQATRALFEAARRLGIPEERMICTGDVVAYCANPRETADLLRQSRVRVVMGNCEEAIARSAPDCGCGFDPGSTCSALSSEWYPFAASNVDGRTRMWMKSLPPRIDFVVGGLRLAVVHGAQTRINKFVFGSRAGRELIAMIKQTGCDGVVAGHMGIPFTMIAEGRLCHNPGAIGVPANDGTPRGWYSLIKPVPEGMPIRHMPLDYDHGTAAKAMCEVALPSGYAEALESGLWPRCHVLAPDDLERRGMQIENSDVSWCRPSMSQGRRIFGDAL